MGDASTPGAATDSPMACLGTTGSPGQISRIAIIGAGPVGLSFAKYLLAEHTFSEIVIYEQRDRVGGIWNLTGNDSSRHISVPQIDPWFGTYSRNATSHDSAGGSTNVNAPLEIESPLYEYLETNIPKQLMAFSDKPFPDAAPLFPGHQAVLEYLEQYSAEVKHLIRFSTKVLDVALKVAEQAGRRKETWSILSRDLTSAAEGTETYDAIVVANGHYTVPFVPAIHGLAAFNQKYPGVVVHSKAYRRPEDFADQKVLVIGNSASGLDIATQVGKFARKPVHLSARSASAFGALPPAEWRKDVDEVFEFLTDPQSPSRAVRYKSGRIEDGYDAVIFATGYFYNFPFLRNLDAQLQEPLITDGSRTRGLYQHLFHIEYPSLVFPVINLKVIPFPLSQNQAAVVGRVWSGRLDLPSKEDMKTWETATVQRKGDGRHFHLKKFPEDAAQVNELFSWAQQAKRRDGLENDGIGKLGTTWDERFVWMRSYFPEIKGAFSRMGGERFNITAVEDLGFDFDRWRERAREADLKMFGDAMCPESVGLRP